VKLQQRVFEVVCLVNHDDAAQKSGHKTKPSVGMIRIRSVSPVLKIEAECGAGLSVQKGLVTAGEALRGRTMTAKIKKKRGGGGRGGGDVRHENNLRQRNALPVGSMTHAADV
jgi:hypothetical protein